MSVRNRHRLAPSHLAEGETTLRSQAPLFSFIAPLALLLPLAVLAIPAPANAEDEESLPGLKVLQEAPIEITVAGDALEGYEVGDVVPIERIEEAGYGRVGEDGDPTTAWGSLALPDDRYDIIASWTDPVGALVNERAGYYTPPNSGFGWRKAHYKHDLSTGAIKTITMKYFSRAPDGGQAIRYRTTMKHILCLTSGCYVMDTLTARAVVDFKTWDARTFGLVTAYCEGYSGACPYWVKDAR